MSSPSFDGFFSGQQRPSAQSSLDTYSQSNTYASTEHFGAIYAQQLGEEPQQFVDEPAALHHQVSGEHLRQHHQFQGQRANSLRGEVERKDSVPFDPTSSSTLIATASNAPHLGQQPHLQLQDPNFQGDPSYQQYYQQQQQQAAAVAAAAQQQQQQHQHVQQQSGEFGVQGGDQYYTTNSALSSAPQSGDWNNQFLPQQESASSHSRRQSWNGSVQLTGSPYEDQQFEELQRIISNASSHAGTPEPGRVASPFIPAEQASAVPAHIDSTSTMARSPSPFAAPSPGMPMPSPPVSHHLHRASSQSLSGSPSFSKPQSPPALIIPNTSPSPSLPPIVTQVVTAPSGGTGAAAPPNGVHASARGAAAAGGGSGGFGNSLLPPVNPALEHLTGMGGISPIAPNADGPMIYIQPSTPISGLKEGGGLFDEALRRASAAQQQQQQQHQHQQHQQQQAPQANQQQAMHAQVANGSSVGQPSLPGSPQPQTQTHDTSAFVNDSQQWASNLNFANLGVNQTRPRANSDSYATMGNKFERQAVLQLMNNPAMQGQQLSVAQGMQSGPVDQDQWINAWRMNQAVEQDQVTLDPRHLPGSDQLLQQQLEQMQVHQQRAQLAQINTADASGGVFKYEPHSPTTMAFLQQLGIQQGGGGMQQPMPGAGLVPPSMQGRRRSFGGEGMHPAAGAGTPGYGVEFMAAGGGMRGPVRGQQMAHRRTGSEGGTGWGMGAGGSTADFVHAMTNPDDGTLLPPMRARTHSRTSSVSSVRSASPALSVSSQGSSYSHHSHMDMPDGMMVSEMLQQHDMGNKVAKMKVTSVATEVASQSRRTNSGIFHCPIPGCGSTFTRHFNLKGHLRSHNDERPYKCLYDGCPKCFARQHDCKRHMLLHEGLRPFECEGCGKKFARLDALTRHHKSEQGQECAISHPLPTNPDGTPMSESQYKAYRMKVLKDKGVLRKLEPGEDPTEMI